MIGSGSEKFDRIRILPKGPDPQQSIYICRAGARAGAGVRAGAEIMDKGGAEVGAENK